MGSQFPDQESNLWPLQPQSPNHWTTREVLSILFSSAQFHDTKYVHILVQPSLLSISQIETLAPVQQHLPAELTCAAHSGVLDKCTMTWSPHHRVIQSCFPALNISRAPHLVLLPHLPNPWQLFFFLFVFFYCRHHFLPFPECRVVGITQEKKL